MRNRSNFIIFFILSVLMVATFIFIPFNNFLTTSNLNSDKGHHIIPNQRLSTSILSQQNHYMGKKRILPSVFSFLRNYIRSKDEINYHNTKESNPVLEDYERQNQMLQNIILRSRQLNSMFFTKSLELNDVESNFEQTKVIQDRLTANGKKTRLNKSLNNNNSNQMTTSLSVYNLSHCRNTYQGPLYVTDERGYLCLMNEVLTNGCCKTPFTIGLKSNAPLDTNTSADSIEPEMEHFNEVENYAMGGHVTLKNENNNSKQIQIASPTYFSLRYDCSKCNDQHCCLTLEHCVSCCLSPAHKSAIARALQKWGHGPDLSLRHVVTNADFYGACLGRCRTSSLSVVHENAYRDPQAKHCFGPALPTIDANQIGLPNRVR